MLNDDVLFDDDCCEAGPLFDRRGNDGCVALDPPDVLRPNIGYMQLHCLDAELCGPFQDDSAAGYLVNRGGLGDAHMFFTPLSR